MKVSLLNDENRWNNIEKKEDSISFSNDDSKENQSHRDKNKKNEH